MIQKMMLGLGVVSLFLAGLPEPVIAQGSNQGTPSHAPVPNTDQLEISMDETKPTALLGGESVITGKITNKSSNPQYNVGWTVQLPQGVEYLGAKAGPADYGDPKATILLFGGGKTETVVHWGNATDISPGESIWFEIRVKNSAPEGNTPKTKGKYFKLEESFNVKAWAKGSTDATRLPIFQDYGYASNVDSDTSWAKDNQPVQIKAIEPVLTIKDQLNSVTIRGNKENQRQKVTVELNRTKYGEVTLTQPVSVDLDPVWEIMGTCVKGGENCFTPQPEHVVWENGKWKLNIPANKFNFDAEGKATVTFEIAALDKDNVEPTNDNQKVNMAGLGGDGNLGNTPRDDVAFKDPAYANNTGRKSANQTVNIDGASQARYVHPWNGANASTYPNVDSIAVDLPDVETRIEDTSVELTTQMVAGGPYKNDKLANKQLTVRNNEYTQLAGDRKILITLSEAECPVAKGTENCVETGTIKIDRTVLDSNGQTTTTEVDGTVSKNSEGKFEITLPAASIDPDTSRTQTFDFKSKVLGTANSKDVVNGKPLVTKAALTWTENAAIQTVTTEAELPPALVEIINLVAFPDSSGNCPAPLTTMPTAEERKAYVDQEENKRLVESLGGAMDIWGKKRKVGSGKDLCFQVFMQFPDGIVTKDPKLDLYLPPEAQLVGQPDAISVEGSLKTIKQLVASSNVPTATAPVMEATLRTPLKYTLGDKAAGGSTMSMVYKATIKNAKVADPAQPEVLYDNLAKLSYKDFEGGLLNARDVSSYEFLGPGSTAQPLVDLNVAVRWSKEAGAAADRVAHYNDYDTETGPVTAMVSIERAKSGELIPPGYEVLFEIPEGWQLREPANKNGWQCHTTQDKPRIIPCEAMRMPPQNTDGPFMFEVVSPSGPGVRLNQKDLTISATWPKRHTVNPVVHDPDHTRRIMSTVMVFIPRPDLAPTVIAPHPFMLETHTQKPFSVDVTRTGDAIRKGEATVVLFTNKPALPVQVTNANGWSCSPTSVNVICIYPLESTGKEEKLPRIEALVNARVDQAPFEISAETVWSRPGKEHFFSPERDIDSTNDLNKLTVTQYQASTPE